MQNKQFSNISVIRNPLSLDNLAKIRDKRTDGEAFQAAFRRLATILMVEAANLLPTTPTIVETPLTRAVVPVVDKSYKIILAPILRAGLGLSDVALQLMPKAKVYHIGMYRDETTFQPVWYYDKSPAKFEKAHKTKVFILDPMLATGGSALAAVDLFVGKGIAPKDIVFVSVISAPEGLGKLTEKYPDVTIITTAIDDKLNEHAYIMPGLGDAGDRLFNTVK